MRSKPIRKNAHKERIFTLRQNRTDFDYSKDRQAEMDNKIHELCDKEEFDYNEKREG